MPLKTYGIFTAYHPGTEFRYEGLGRYLANFVRQGSEDTDIRFVIACPSWSRKAIDDLLKDAGVDRASYSIIGPTQPPLALSVYEKWQNFRQRRSRAKVAKPAGRLSRLASSHTIWLMQRLGVTRNHFLFISIGAYLAVLLVLLAPLLVLRAIGRLLAAYPGRWFERVRPNLRLAFLRSMDLLRLLLRIPGDADLRSWAFQQAHRSEVDALLVCMKDEGDVRAWYCPTAIWPAIVRTGGPVLICVPDIVLTEFPVAFSQIGGTPMEQSFDGILETLDRGRAFVTYSERIKADILVDRFGVDPKLITVVPHAANRLDHLVKVNNFSDPSRASDAYCRMLLESGLQKAAGAFPRDFHGSDFRFLFYASQFRPSKNVLTLLRAFRYLVKEKYFGRKLVLTGDPATMPSLFQYVTNHGMLNDVVFLPGLSDSQLAAFYRMADLAVNPSLSEGGMPFTFTEAVSVGTPVVMSDIAVTREVLSDERLRAETLFDPYDWRAMARHIERALGDRAGLFDRQRAFFEGHLAKRTWHDVVHEHIAIMDRLVETHGGKAA